jgi:hypothetical protein
MENISIDQWSQLFILAVGILVVCSFVSMISIWIVSSKLSDIVERLDKLIPRNIDK